MSKTTIALEGLVADVIANRASDGEKQTARQRANTDKAFAAILKLIAPRIRHFIRQYGLVAHWEDAEQACAIGVHRAIEGYDPDKAQFTTFVNWQLRGELQSLRFRLMTDQRSSAKRVEATTVSLHAMATGNGEDGAFETLIEDEDALEMLESGVSCYLAENAMRALIDEYVEHLRKLGIEQLQRRPRAKRLTAERQPETMPAHLPPCYRGLDPVEAEKLEQNLARNRELIERRLFDTATLDQLSADTGITKERIRQITKRAAKTIGELAGSLPRFAVMAAHDLPTRSRAGRIVARVAPVTILPSLGQAHHRTRVVEVTPDAASIAFAQAARTDDRHALATDLVDQAIVAASVALGSHALKR